MAKTKTVVTRAEAKKLMWEYYRDNKSSLPKWIGECREEILEELMDGKCVVNTFRSFVDSETSTIDNDAPQLQATG
jgi:hypothetical protein